MSQVFRESQPSLAGKFVRLVNPEYVDKRTRGILESVAFLLFVSSESEDSITVICKEDSGVSSFTVARPNFEANFKVEPDDVIEQELRLLLSQAADVRQQAEDLGKDIAKLALATQGGEIPNAPNRLALQGEVIHPNDPLVSQSLDSSQNNPIDIARSFGRNVAEYRDAFNARKDALSAFLRKIKALEMLRLCHMESLLTVRSQIEKLETVLKSINLYLGTGEEIVQLRQGRWADDSTLLHVRQLVLFADEESAILVDQGGLDFKYLDDFDDWLISNEAHIRQIIPEEKCIVAIKPRRKPRRYDSGDPFFEDRANRENKRTYILIRHGENLFRVAPEWAVGFKLFPTQKEMDEKFSSSIKAFDEANAHYRNSLVLIQGIIDRTGIFPDLQNRGVNLLSPSTFANNVVLVNDADESQLLTTGRETFSEYRKRINANLEAGHRVIVGYVSSGEDFTERFYPSRSYSLPDANRLYTLEKHPRANFCIRYENESYWARPKSRVSLSLYRSDDCLLAYDLVTLEEMDYFLNDRLSRREYLNLIPMVKRIRDLKAQEAEAERPFILLLASEIEKLSPELKRAESIAKAQDLLKWWKFKNKVHRAVDQSEVKALKQILLAYRQSDPELPFDYASVVNPKTLLVYQDSRKAVRIDRHDNFGVLVDVTEYSLKKGNWIQTKQEQGVIFSKNLPTTKIVFEHDSWKQWAQGPTYRKTSSFWREAAVKTVLDQFDEIYKSIELDIAHLLETDRWERTPSPRQLLQSLPLAVRFKGMSSVVEVWVYLESIAAKSKACKIKQEIKRFSFYLDARTGSLTRRGDSTYVYRHTRKEILEATVADEWFQASDSHFFGKIFAENVAKLLDAERAAEEYNNEVQDLFTYADGRVNQFIDHCNGLIEQAALQKYLDQFGDIRNWKSYQQKAGIKFVSRNETTLLWHVARHLWADQERFSRSLFVGKTWGEFEAIWATIGLLGDNASSDLYWAALNDSRLYPSRLKLIAPEFILFPEQPGS